MPQNLNPLVYTSDLPAFRNFKSDEFTIVFSGSLPAPGGGDITTLTKSGTVPFDQTARATTIFIKPHDDYDPDVGDPEYSGGQLLDVTSFPNVYSNTDSTPAGGNTSWPIMVFVSFKNSQLTVDLTAFNSGGTSYDLDFPAANFTIRYLSFLPTQ